MRLVMNSVEFSLYELDSESELKKHIMANNGVIMGNDAQVKSKFYVIEYMTDNGKYIIGILNEGHGILPTVTKFKNSDVIVLTSDKSIYFFDSKKNKVIKSILCDSLIFDVINRENEETIFIVCELGIQSLTTKGDIVWTYDSEVITDYTFYDSYVKLMIEDTEYKISLLNGKLI